ATREAPGSRAARRRGRRGEWRGRTSPTGEQRERGVVQTAVGRERMAGIDRGLAGQIGEASSRLLDDDLARGEIPRLQIYLDIHLSLPFGHQPIPEVVAEAALALGGVYESHQAVPDA